MWLGKAEGTQRWLKWFGQETGRDSEVRPGTQVWLREGDKLFFDHVGHIAYSVQVRKYDRMRVYRSASYNSLIDLLPNPTRVHKAEKDLFTELTVLNYANIHTAELSVPKKVYSSMY